MLDDEREYTLEEIAAELRLDERSIRRIEIAALAKLRAMLDENYFSTGKTIPRRFENESTSGVDHDARAASPSSLPDGAVRRARLPRRFRSKP